MESNSIREISIEINLDQNSSSRRKKCGGIFSSLAFSRDQTINMEGAQQTSRRRNQEIDGHLWLWLYWL